MSMRRDGCEERAGRLQLGVAGYVRVCSGAKNGRGAALTWPPRAGRRALCAHHLRVDGALALELGLVPLECLLLAVGKVTARVVLGHPMLQVIVSNARDRQRVRGTYCAAEVVTTVCALAYYA